MTGLTAIAAVAYPVLVYIGLTRWSARYIGLVIVVFAAATLGARLADPKKRRAAKAIVIVPACVISLAALSAILDNATFVLFTPVLINISLLLTFGVTLRSGATPIIENFARLQEPDLSPDELEWCRQLTAVWCVFFVLNGLAALILALAAPIAWWALYTGAISYALMGALFAIELIARKSRFQKFGSGLLDRVLARFLLQEQQP